MQAYFYVIVRNGFSMNFSIRGSRTWWLLARMVHVTALDIQVSLRNPTAVLEDSMTSVKTLYCSAICEGTIRAPVFRRNENSAPQSITEKPMEVYYLDKWFVITQYMYVAGLLHPEIFY